jgi:hypothetical protein
MVSNTATAKERIFASDRIQYHSEVLKRIDLWEATRWPFEKF